MIGAFFVAGLGMILAGAGVALTSALEPWDWGRWLAVHLMFVGGISQLVLGASQFFAGAFLATDPPTRGLIRSQLGLWNAGVLMLGVAVPARSGVCVFLAVGVLVAGLACYAAGLAQMGNRSLGSAPWATRWYAAAALSLSVGLIAGAVLATGTPWSQGNLLGAHMTLNLRGWFGFAIVGTLHTFFPSLTGSRLWAPRLQGPTFAAWACGIGALAAGFAFALDGLTIVGWFFLLASSTMLTLNVIGSLCTATRPLALAARVVASGQVFLVLGLLTATAAAVTVTPGEAVSGPSRGALGTLLVVGWIGLTVIGSLLHLLALLVRVRHLGGQMPEPHPVRDSVLTALAAIGVAGVAVEGAIGAGGLEMHASKLLLAAYAILGARVLLLAVRVLSSARPQL